MMRLFLLFSLLILASACTFQKTPKLIDQDSAANIVKEALAIRGPVTAKELYGGYSSAAQLFLVTAEDKKYVIRFLSRAPEEIESEMACLSIASKCGYGPHIYAADPSKSFIVMEYLTRVPITQEDRASFRMYRALGQVVSKMHHGPNFWSVTNIFEDTHRDIMRLKKNKDFQAVAIKMEEMLLEIHRDVAPFLQSAPCHDDLNPNNIIFTGSSFKIIDYESATQDDPYFDLATVSMFYCFEPWQEEEFLNSYFQKPALPQEKAKLYLMKQASLLVFSLRAFLGLEGGPYDWDLPPDSYPSFMEHMVGKGVGDISDPKVRFRWGRFLFQQAATNFCSSEFQEAVKLLHDN
jgi:Ser/Thr protein kinase RdoA (MazF antagonist)